MLMLQNSNLFGENAQQFNRVSGIQRRMLLHDLVNFLAQLYGTTVDGKGNVDSFFPMFANQSKMK
eukprot:CAMPEP_0168565886 /NCGR_PEP_ID=MMETSP0413-20121227/14106_1 /TAXON_ID=136452 /ORGANISM="Filamoeba nolandi, Strain NC-AS-23-1" /LENGTH=64 /DNA_ID=CAMNT_0008597831 /DNA_START=49 /DNA_END=240 /DNA_ORIENTATION=-